MPDPRAYRTLEFMRTTFLNSLNDLARDDQRWVIRALEHSCLGAARPSTLPTLQQDGASAHLTKDV